MLLQILGLGPSELVIVVLFVVILVLGPKKIPELFRSLGQSMGEFKKGAKESEEEVAAPKKKAKKKKPEAEEKKEE